MKRRGREKRYEDLQSVSMATVTYATASCAAMSSKSPPNGSESDCEAPPTARTKDVWPQEAAQLHQDQDQGWVPSPRTWTEGGNRAQEQLWRDGRDTIQNQQWEEGQQRGAEPVWEWRSSRIQNHSWENIWRPDVNMKKVQRVEPEGNHLLPQPPGGSVPSEFPPFEPPGSGGTGLQLQAVREHKDWKPGTKEAPPTFPPGSEEELWQLQIEAKGRATCPRCRRVSRKTLEGLKKHMDTCTQQPFTCPHCEKQLKSSTGMKYHIMADHSHLPSADVNDRAAKDKLRKVLKRLGRLKCSTQGCGAAFTSIMGYVYHMRKCGKEQSELEKMLLSCSLCGKTYRSKAGLEYHLKSEHAPTPHKPDEEQDKSLKNFTESKPERTPSGRVQRASALVANFHLAEIASNEPPKDWPKRKFQSDLVPDDKKLKYSRPGLPAFSQEVLRKWKNEVKLQRKVQCPNQGDFEVGKYRCLICSKEFHSESGVKYHINTVHSQEWFVTNKKASKKLEKFLRNQPSTLFPHPHILHFTPLQPLTVWVEPNQEGGSPQLVQAAIDAEEETKALRTKKEKE
ncbi:zinc finger protein 512 isoform X2 [Gouania willdenowi]|uniref:zinc finger protein 512 isoform X2 n=1 Tax=Gouania willdenowi TaxID=441366 RepID=UPI0010552003|nr:zinc finger protein 512 isoform X2 [Gouania willdenowi]